MMLNTDPIIILFTAVGIVLMAFALFRGMASSSVGHAQFLIDVRRSTETQRRQAIAEAEAHGRAAALEPLNLNADGSIEAPIIAVVEGTPGS